MKIRYFIFIIIAITIIACDPNSNSINTNNHDWWYEIRVNGVPHRIEGTFNSCDIYYNWDFYSGGNTGTYLTNGLVAVLNNKAEADYVSGETFNITMHAQNLSLGMNDFNLFETINGSESFIGVDCYPYPYTNGLFGFFLQPTDTVALMTSSSIFPINITQLPTPGQIYLTNGACYDVGTPIIGNGSATIYVLDTIDNSLPESKKYRFRRPYNIDIDFKLYMNQ